MSKEIIDEINAFKRGEYISPVKSIEDEIEEFKQNKLREESKIISPPIYEQTLEGKYLQPIYDVAEPLLKGASILQKPFSASMAAGRSIGKLISGQENPEQPFVEEITSLFPTEAGAFTADLAESDTGTEPFIEELPENIKAQFPKASTFIENIDPNTVTEMVAGGVLGSKIPGASRSQKAGLIEGDPSLAKKALIRAGETDKNYIGELKSTGKFDSVVNKVLTEKSLLKNIDNPTRMIDTLQGVKREITDPKTGVRKSVPVVVGKIDQAGEIVGNSLKKLSKKAPEIVVDEMVTKITNEIMDEVNRVGSGIDVSPEMVKKEISKYIKQPNEMDMFDFEAPTSLSVRELVDIKRGAADQLYKMKSVVADLDSTNIKKLVADKLWEDSTKRINEIATKFDDYDLLKANNDFSDYQKLRDIYSNKDIAQAKVPTMLESLIPAGLVGVGTAGVTGNPYMGLLAAGGFQGARSTIGNLAEDAPSMALRTRMGAIEPALGAAGAIKPSVMAASLAAYQIPRNSDQIVEQADMFIAKLAQNIRTPQDKTLYDEVLNIMNTDPNQISTILPILVQSYPQLFKQDKYGRVNGVVNPMLKQKAIEDMMKRGGSPLENAKKAERLINDNIMED
jgi:hypothetical protein